LGWYKGHLLFDARHGTPVVEHVDDAVAGEAAEILGFQPVPVP
jgi:hypothetical protein